MLTSCQWYEVLYKDDADDEMETISYDDYEIMQFFQIRGIMEATIAAIVNFAGLPLSPETFFPPEAEFEVLRQVRQSGDYSISFNPQSEAMLSCITKGWLHIEQSRQGGFRCYFPTYFHNKYETCHFPKPGMRTNIRTGSWNTSWESRILDIPPRLLWPERNLS